MAKEVELTEAYKMMTPGFPLIIATKGAKSGLYDLTPIGWISPLDYEPVTKVMFSCSPSHQADANIRRTGTFAVVIPSKADSALVNNTGSVSSPDADKFSRFGIKAVPCSKIDAKIPAEDISGWIECRLIRTIAEGTVDVFFGEALAAYRI